jgi:hypothetical protein
MRSAKTNEKSCSGHTWLQCKHTNPFKQIEHTDARGDVEYAKWVEVRKCINKLSDITTTVAKDVVNRSWRRSERRICRWCCRHSWGCRREHQRGLFMLASIGACRIKESRRIARSKSSILPVEMKSWGGRWSNLWDVKRCLFSFRTRR